MDLAPLHSEAHLKGYEAVRAMLPNLPQVFVFDTSFHQTMPEEAYMYAVPYKYYENNNIRRWGAHGTSHRFVSARVCEFLGVKAEDVRIITCHIGNGASVSAVKYGKCVDTSMGLTPLEGLMMGTRSGDVDPSAVLAIMKVEGYDADRMSDLLNKESGVKGISGVSSDIREVEAAIKKYAVVEHPEFGKIYAFEVDGMGNRFLMDDANVPSLLALPYLGDVSIDDPIWQNTRKFVWSSSNPYFFKGKAGEGIGGPHVGYDMVWPMSIMMKAFTSTDDKEIKWCIETLMKTDAGTGFIHETFHKDNPENFTRSWFAWANTLFGELIVHLIDEGKLDLLNSIKVKKS